MTSRDSATNIRRPLRYGQRVSDAVASDPTPPAQPRHLGAGAALSVIADMGPLVAAAVLSIVLARSIGPAANGTYALLLTLVNISVLVFSFGLGAGITYEVSRGTWPVRRAFIEAYGAAAVLGVGGAVTGFGFYLLTENTALSAVEPHLAVIALAAIPAFLAWQLAAGILLGCDRYEGYAGLQLASSLVLLLSAAGLALPFGLTGAVAGLAASGVVTAAVGAWMLSRGREPRHGPPLRGRDPRTGLDHMRRAFKFGVQSWIGNILQQANYRLDLLILGAFAAASAVGTYSVAVTITSIGWILPHGLQMVVFPRTARLDAAAESGDLSKEASDAAAARAVRHSVLLLVPAGVVVAVLLVVVPLVYGAEFHQTVSLGFLLLPGVLALGVGKVLGSVVAGRGRPRYMMWSGVLGAAVTLVLYAILIPPYEEWGAAGASCLSYLLTTLIVVEFFRRTTGIPLRDALVPTRADVRNYREALVALRGHVRSRWRPGGQAA